METATSGGPDRSMEAFLQERAQQLFLLTDQERKGFIVKRDMQVQLHLMTDPGSNDCYWVANLAVAIAVLRCQWNETRGYVLLRKCFFKGSFFLSGRNRRPNTRPSLNVVVKQFQPPPTLTGYLLKFHLHFILPFKHRSFFPSAFPTNILLRSVVSIATYPRQHSHSLLQVSSRSMTKIFVLS
jgi:hypothetical protein